MKAMLFTNEYPPNVYGGAGVHVEYLSKALARHIPVEVRCFGNQDVQQDHIHVKGYEAWEEMKRNTDSRFVGALGAFSRSLAMAKDQHNATIAHCHTWYTDMAGFFASTLWDIPYVVTTHSLEPLRPWKVEQLGAGYHLSTWMEKTAIENAHAVIAVSQETRKDVLRLFDVPPERVHVIYNGIDLHQYKKTQDTEMVQKLGIDPTRPYALFVGRITRQKGIIHLVRAIAHIDPAIQVVLCAGAPDTEEIGREMSEGVDRVCATRQGVIWIQQMLPREELIPLYSHAAVFCCPSVYEPFGIINLEAMACETAVVASAIGGIPEVVVHNETGILVDLELQPGTFDPADPEQYARDLAAAINDVALDEAKNSRFGSAGRKRAEAHFNWDAIALQTLELYRSLL
jgi:glycogen synthase